MIFADGYHQTSEGTAFVLAFPPAEGRASYGQCQIIVTARDTTSVSVYDENGLLAQTTVDGGTTHNFDLSCNLRTERKSEDQGIRVVADSDITVQVLSKDEDGKMAT